MNTQDTGKIRPITKRKHFSETAKHFKLKKPFDPVVEIFVGYTGHWEIYNMYGVEHGVTEEQKTFMLDLIRLHGGLAGGAK